MKNGRTLKEIATQITEEKNSKRDFVADTRSLEMLDGQGFALEGIGRFDATDLFHDQVAARLQIPKKYYDRMRTAAPDLLTANVNRWFQQEPDKRMIRTLGGNARAFLSERYRPLDNFDLAEAVLPRLTDLKCEIKSVEITETRLYIKAVTARIAGEVKVGDTVQAGVAISNSEVGCGSISIEPLIYTLSCTNGMIVQDYSMRKFHIGKAFGEDGEAGGVAEFFRSETRLADDKAFWMKVQDLVAGTLSRDGFDRMLGRMREAAGIKIDCDPVKVVERVASTYALTEGERGGVLNHLISDGDLSKYGLVNAITRTSQDVESYDRATELERLGGQVLELAPQDWNKIASLN